MPHTTAEILLIEDNPGDVSLLKTAFSAVGRPVGLSVVQRGDEAMQFLRRTGSYSQAPRPDIILLDLNLPGREGLEVLAEIKCDTQFRQIPVVALTSSSLEQDIYVAYDLGANCYLVKPSDINQLEDIARWICIFWLGIVELPPAS